MTRKSFDSFRIKDADQGLVEAVFSTFGVVDHDGDVTYKSSFEPGAPVVISAYGHTSWAGELPVGKGAIRVTDSEAILDGQFFMDTTHGRDTFLTVQELSKADLQEWSYSLHDVVVESVEVDGNKARGLKKITVKEVSPVLMGASINTRTLAAKSAKQTANAVGRLLRDAGRERWADEQTYLWVDDWDVDEQWAVFDIEGDDATRLVRVDFTRDGDSVTLGDTETEVQRTTTYAPKSGARFAEQATAVMADVDQLIARASEVVALRAAKGKALAAESVDLLTRLDGQLDALKQCLTQPPDPDSDAIAREILRAVAHLQGVTP